MMERNRVQRQSPKPKSSILSFFQSIFAVIGVISTLFICMIMALTAISPSNLQDIVMQIYPIDTQEPQFVVVTATQPLPTTTPTPPLVTNTPELSPPSGEWAVRAYYTDDFNMLLVNGHIVGASSLEGATKDTGWISINSYLNEGDSNYVTFVNVNGSSMGNWSFELQHDGTTIWGDEGKTGIINTIGYSQTIQIFANNKIKEVLPDDLPGDHLGGKWDAKVAAKDVGLIFINGFPTAAGCYGMDFGWFNANDLLFSDRDNVVTASVWNFTGDFSWDLAIQKDETLVWSSDSQGTEQLGEVFYASFIIDSNGNVIP